MRSLEKGDFSSRTHKATTKEMNKVFQSFNEMAETLNDYRKELEESREILEVKVRARTRELQNMTNNLEKK